MIMGERTKTNFGKILIYAQFWDGDQVQMMELLSLLADLEKYPNERAEFVLYPRIGTRTRDREMIYKLATKFPTYESKSRRNLSGWPTGPNAVAMDAFRDSHEKFKAGEFKYDAAMLMEADCVPLKANWIEDLYQEWANQSKWFLGHWDGGLDDPAPKSHMNGNLLFHPSAFDVHPQMAYGEVPRGGWDMVFWGMMRPMSTPSRLIFSDYHLGTRSNPMDNCERLWIPRQHIHPSNPLVGQQLDISWLHGPKGLKGIKCVRSRLIC